jgi:hypothetical protein
MKKILKYTRGLSLTAAKVLPFWGKTMAIFHYFQKKLMIYCNFYLTNSQQYAIFAKKIA